jgi:hypothetical protein
MLRYSNFFNISGLGKYIEYYFRNVVSKILNLFLKSIFVVKKGENGPS